MNIAQQNTTTTSTHGQWAIKLAFIVAITAAHAVAAMEPELEKIHAKIERSYAKIEHIDADTFAKLPPEVVVVFDIRKASEFRVSHIKGAIHVEPGVEPEAFIAAHGDILKGRTAVFYCSVGRRSSAFATRVADLVKESGATGLHNLAGGLFHWHNEERPLMCDGEVTTAIHPYNFYWGRLVSDKSAIRYTPEKSR